MMKTGRKTVKGSKTSAPMVARSTARSTQTSKVASGTAIAPRVAKRVPTREEIARRSFEIFLERGGEHGHDVEHWAQAERELGS